MSSGLLDTSVVVDWHDPDVLRALPDEMAISAITAAELAADRMTRDFDHARMLFNKARTALGPDWIVNGNIDWRYPGNLNIRRDGVDGARLIADLRGVAFSLGSACASGSGRPSHVLKAIGLDHRAARSSIRLGFGRYTECDDLVAACRMIREAADAQENLPA